MKSKFLVGCLSLFILGCGSGTQVVGSWKSDVVSERDTYDKVFITAITANAEVQNILENEMASASMQNGITAIKAHDIFKQRFTAEKQPDKAMLLAAVRSSDADAIFTVALRDTKTETKYNPGTTSYYPVSYGYYGRFYNYYNTVYPINHDPGYYSTDKIYYLESNLYDSSTEELLWSAQSKTVNPSNIEDFAKEYTHVIVKQLVKDGVLTP